MEGEQIFKAAQTYSKEVINDLPEEVKGDIVIRSIAKKGMLEFDKESVEKKRIRQEDKQKSYKRKIHSVNEHQDNAKKMKVDNDETFVAKSTEQMKKERLIESSLGMTHWDKMSKVKWVEVLPIVMPLFWKSSTMHNMLKKDLRPLLQTYLNDVKEISSKKKRNSLTEDQLENLSYYEIVSKFINFDHMDLIFPTETKTERNTNFRKDLWSSIGCTILKRKRYTLNKSDLSQDNEGDVQDLDFLHEDDLNIEDE